MKYLSIIGMVAMLCGCATQEVILRNASGETVRCGGNVEGSIAGGMIGYAVQAELDKQCAEDAEKRGYRPIATKPATVAGHVAE
ncbi:MAG TPA: hypothetical protein PK205_07005 [Promineifilum sp.]|nr:hypothetical protein [Promineifilum sp.]